MSIYMLTSEEIDFNRHEIESLLKSVDRKGLDSVLHYLAINGFYEVPSSLHRHHNWRGGLAQHCLGVYKRAVEMSPELPKDSLIIASILHDICKTRKYFYDKNGDVHHRYTHIRGHGYRSVKILELCGLDLTEDERRAIRWHMGGHHAKDADKSEVAIARHTKLWKVVHEADKLDAKKGKSIMNF